MKKFFSIIVMALAVMMTSCNEWLDILPNNEQVTDNYWKTKEDVEAVVASGYYYMRQTVPSLIVWGEVRGGSLFSTNSNHALLQNFNLTAESSICNYSSVYKVIGMANSVLKYAPSVMTEDATYYESVMKSHLCEAYFMRAYCYLILVKNFKEVPLIVDAYVNDDADYMVGKSSEDLIIAQIKADVKSALETGAAKETYEDTDGYGWQTKGRATKWALYALMADVCLWNHDYDEAIMYANFILETSEGDTSFRPRLISQTSQWYEIFYPGNSNESIFELNWERTLSQNNNFGSWFTVSSSSVMKFTEYARELMIEETDEAVRNSSSDFTERKGRMLFATYVTDGTDQSKYSNAQNFCVWKYKGTDVVEIANTRPSEDANFILYRVPDMMLIKAEALIMKGGVDSWGSALALINTLRARAGIDALDIDAAATDEITMLTSVLHEWNMEFLAEGKHWYDLLRLSRYDQGDGVYLQKAIDAVVEGNQTTKDEWIRSVLQDKNAWYMPIPYSETSINPNLEQNPYYATTK